MNYVKCPEDSQNLVGLQKKFVCPSFFPKISSLKTGKKYYDKFQKIVRLYKHSNTNVTNYNYHNFMHLVLLIDVRMLVFDIYWYVNAPLGD